MAEISLVRVDSRLIHGQVITKWRKVCMISKIIIVDNELANDDFMIHIYEASAPKDIIVKVYSVERAKKLWDKNQFKAGSVMLLFKDIETCLELHNQGIPFEKIQLGGLPKTQDKKVILKAVSLGTKDMEMLQKLENDHVSVTIQIVPEEALLTFDEIKRKFKEN